MVFAKWNIKEAVRLAPISNSSSTALGIRMKKESIFSKTRGRYTTFDIFATFKTFPAPLQFQLLKWVQRECSSVCTGHCKWKVSIFWTAVASGCSSKVVPRLYVSLLGNEEKKKQQEGGGEGCSCFGKAPG